MVENLVLYEVGDFCWSARSSKVGWLICQGGTIGSAASGATALAGDAALELFTVLWEGHSNAVLPIQTSAGEAGTRGASAAADFAANKRLPLPHAGGRGLIGTGQGSGLTSRALGDVGGAETHTLTAAQIPPLEAEEAGSHTHSDYYQSAVLNSSSGGEAGDGGDTVIPITNYSITNSGSTTDTGAAGSHTHPVNSGGGQAHNNMQPFLAENLFIYVGV